MHPLHLPSPQTKRLDLNLSPTDANVKVNSPLHSLQPHHLQRLPRRRAIPRRRRLQPSLPNRQLSRSSRHSRHRSFRHRAFRHHGPVGGISCGLLDHIRGYGACGRGGVLWAEEGGLGGGEGGVIVRLFSFSLENLQRSLLLLF